MQPARKLSPPAPIAEAWLTVTEAAEMAGVTRQTIWAWVMAGRVETTSFGNRRAVSREGITRIVRAKAAAAAAQAAVLAGEA